MSDVASRLAKKFGLGSRPDLRQQLYDRLQWLIHQDNGDRAYQIVASVAADAVGKRDPGRYFAHVVCARLQEKGIIPPPEEVF